MNYFLVKSESNSKESSQIVESFLIKNVDEMPSNSNT